jgi:phosphonate metabolism-associated iron-containing alcohol dehydrogenase
VLSRATTWSHFNPVRVVISDLDELAKYVDRQHILFVTTPGFVRRGMANRIIELFKGKKITILDDIKANPDIQYMENTNESLKHKGIDCVVAMGGGSVMDVAKVLATTLKNSNEPSLTQVFRHKRDVQWTSRLPLLVLPTTSGTGAEVTPFATVWDHFYHKKYSMSAECLYPDVALLDSSLTVTLGEDDTLYPALDTISHALESLWNKNSTPVSRGFAFQSLELSTQSLPIIMNNLSNLELRHKLQIASLNAGLAISQTKTAIAHSISYPLTIYHGVPHGLACSFTLPNLLMQNLTKLHNNERERIILSNILTVITGFALEKRVLKYVSKINIMALKDFMLDKERSGNYIGQLNDGLEGLIEKTFERV